MTHVSFPKACCHHQCNNCQNGNFRYPPVRDEELGIHPIPRDGVPLPDLPPNRQNYRRNPQQQQRAGQHHQHPLLDGRLRGVSDSAVYDTFQRLGIRESGDEDDLGDKNPLGTMARQLEAPQHEQGYEVTDMQAVGSGIEPAVQRAHPTIEPGGKIFLARDLEDQATGVKLL